MIAIYTRLIPDSPRGQRRQQEREAAAALCADLFGPYARITHDPDGAPAVEGITNPPHISISHCGNRVVMAVSRDSRVGIDYQQFTPSVSRVIHRVLTPGEQHLSPTLTATTMLRLWTAKEAVFKAAGDPSLVISQITVSPDFTTATANGLVFNLYYPESDAEACMCIALP